MSFLSSSLHILCELNDGPHTTRMTHMGRIERCWGSRNWLHDGTEEHMCCARKGCLGSNPQLPAIQLPHPACIEISSLATLGSDTAVTALQITHNNARPIVWFNVGVPIGNYIVWMMGYHDRVVRDWIDLSKRRTQCLLPARKKRRILWFRHKRSSPYMIASIFSFRQCGANNFGDKSRVAFQCSGKPSGYQCRCCSHCERCR